MPVNEKKERLNPQIASLDIGTRNLRTIKIYPASFGDQLELTDLITSTIQEFYGSQDKIEVKNDMAIVKFVLNLIKDNLARIVKLVTDEDEAVFKETTNFQIIKLAETIYEMNYAESSKNVASLLKNIQKSFQLKRQ